MNSSNVDSVFAGLGYLVTTLSTGYDGFGDALGLFSFTCPYCLRQ